MTYLQFVLHTIARVIFPKCKSDHLTHPLRTLHWLSIALRRETKTLPMVAKALWGLLPVYFSSPVSLQESIGLLLLFVPQTCHVISHHLTRAYSVQSARPLTHLLYFPQTLFNLLD